MIVKRDIDQIQSYLKDASGYAGKFEAVYIPDTTEELRQIISELFGSKIPFTISGAGTGLTGGRSATEGVVISTENLNRIIEVDYNKRLARIEAGVLLKDLQEELQSKGYFFPPNPTENNSSIGGNIALNASGSRTFKYGAYRNYVRELKIILADGDEIVLKRDSNNLENELLTLITSQNRTYAIPLSDINMPDIKHNAGYYLKRSMEPIDLFIGSEGTLGVITEAVLSFDKEPENVLGLMIFFNNISKLLNLVGNVRDVSKVNNLQDYRIQSDISARLIEIYDGKALQLIRANYPQIPDNAAGCLWIEQEYASENEEKLIDNWNKLISGATSLADKTWIALSQNEHNRMRDLRHEIPLRVNEILSSNNQRKVGTDTAVPDDKFVGFYNYINDMFEKSGIESAIWGHAGNSHLHANLLPATIKEFEKSLELFNLIIEKCLEFKGTVSAEHGIGKIKKEYLEKMFGDKNIDKMKQIKNILDPYNLLGRGNLFD